MSEELKMSATNLGFDASWIAELVERFGQDVLTLVVEAARQGLSISLVIEIIQKFGPALLDFVVELLNKKSMLGLTGDVVEGPTVEGVNSAFIDVIIEKWLP